MLGDGGVMFTIAELAAAAQARLAIPVIIVDNGGYGEIRNEMADRHDAVHAVELGYTRLPRLWPSPWAATPSPSNRLRRWAMRSPRLSVRPSHPDPRARDR